MLVASSARYTHRLTEQNWNWLYSVSEHAPTQDAVPAVGRHFQDVIAEHIGHRVQVRGIGGDAEWTVANEPPNGWLYVGFSVACLSCRISLSTQWSLDTQPKYRTREREVCGPEQGRLLAESVEAAQTMPTRREMSGILNEVVREQFARAGRSQVEPTWHGPTHS
ncbi:hypothetical protein ACFY0Z_30120 [Streptomyces kronopolitis]|uniref:hypothetical protein n=1 Tax=Streptomyces kronopolitis TaxID=1612435 RepID=UPI0036B6C12A